VRSTGLTPSSAARHSSSTPSPSSSPKVDSFAIAIAFTIAFFAFSTKTLDL
jgi:hypothetical protein